MCVLCHSLHADTDSEAKDCDPGQAYLPAEGLEKGLGVVMLACSDIAMVGGRGLWQILQTDFNRAEVWEYGIPSGKNTV